MFSCILTFLLPASARCEPETRSVHLAAGESTEVNFPLGTDLAISRRGIVDAFHLGEGRWQLTGLHAGFVVVDGHDATSGEARWPRLFIDVAAPGESTAPLTAPPPVVPPWICAAAGISCELPAGIVRGTATSHLWYLRARTACAGASGCLFAATLTPAAQAQWLSELRLALGEPYKVTATATGIPLIAVYCGKNGRDRRREEADLLTGHALSSGFVGLRCQEETSFFRYRLRLHLYALEASTLDELGLGTQTDVQFSLPWTTASHAALLARLALLTQQRRAEMIGDPVFRLTPNQQAELTSGGEFQVIEHVVREERDTDTIDRVDWKQQGLTLKVTASPLSAERVRLAYEMGFRSRDSRSADALSINTLKSELDVALGQPVMAGLLDLHGSGNDTDSPALLGRLPILGPIFQHSQRQSSQMHLLFWLQLDVDDSIGAIPEGPPLPAPP